jgi:tRNA (adenine37-N6)-methyltransferase
VAENMFTLQPIGTVGTDQEGFIVRIDEPFRDALTGLDGFSHISVLWWFHLLDAPEYRQVVLVEQPYRDAPDQIGVFATRSPVRPNPLALTPVPLLSVDVDAGIVRIGFIDAEVGSPVLDIKPYHPSVDRVRDCAVPDWCAGWPSWYEDSMTFDWSAVFVNAE